MSERLLLPLHPIYFSDKSVYPKNSDLITITAWFEIRKQRIFDIWHKLQFRPQAPLPHDPIVLAQKVFKLLTHHDFNYQSKGQVSPLNARVQENLLHQISRNNPIRFFLLYNGGYRASPMPQRQSLIFQPDQTELMLIYQIARLDEKIKSIYAPGMEFFIVVNNGVAWWVNNIELQATEGYAHYLRQMISSFCGSQSVRVLLQSELPDFTPDFNWSADVPLPLLSSKDQRIVERFLGRTCPQDEAAHRAALYQAAESQWATTLQALAIRNGALMLRQIAHPEMLSFRPFPGGAIRIQNGSLGFHVKDSQWRPKLITAETVSKYSVECVPYQVTSPQACTFDREGEMSCA